MFSPQAEQALARLMQALTQQPDLEEPVHERWRSRVAATSSLPAELTDAIDVLGGALSALGQPGADVGSLGGLGGSDVIRGRMRR